MHELSSSFRKKNIVRHTYEMIVQESVNLVGNGMDNTGCEAASGTLGRNTSCGKLIKYTRKGLKIVLKRNLIIF